MTKLYDMDYEGSGPLPFLEKTKITQLMEERIRMEEERMMKENKLLRKVNILENMLFLLYVTLIVVGFIFWVLN